MSAESLTTTHNRFIAGDWGTSNLRVYLCEYAKSGSRILDTRLGAGVSQIKDDFEEHFFNLAQEWLDENTNIPVLLSGMIGSTIGWKETPYLNCPVSTQQIAQGRITFKARGTEFSILSGVRTNNPLGSSDVMRGEELQLLGWIRSQGTQTRRQLFALPGTHNKWALSENGNISNFLTAFTGELFALLRNHSILITERRSFRFNHDVFMQGVNAIKSMDNAQLIHALFATRAKQVLGEIDKEDGLSYLSGLIISADVKSAIALFGETDSITIIGEPMLAEHYQLVIQNMGLRAVSCEPVSIAISGFEAIYQNIFSPE